MRRTMVAVAALAMVLSACEIRAEIEVEEDGSGTFGFVFGMEEALFGSLPPGMDPLASARRDLAGDPIPWRVEDFRENGLRGFRATVAFDSVEQLLAMLEQQAQADGQALFATGDDAFVLERVAGGGWRFAATGEGPSDLDANPFGGQGGSPSFGGDFGDPATDFGGDLSFTPQMPDLPAGADTILRLEFHVTLPGDAADSNADEVRRSGGGSTFVWRANLADQGPMALSATTTPASGSFPILPVAALALLALGAVVAWRRLRGGGSGSPPVVLEGWPPTVDGARPVGATVGAAPAPATPATPQQPSLLDELGDDSA